MTGLPISSPLRQVLKPRSESRPVSSESSKAEYSHVKVMSSSQLDHLQSPDTSRSLVPLPRFVFYLRIRCEVPRRVTPLQSRGATLAGVSAWPRMHCNLALFGVAYLMKLYPLILRETRRGSIDQVAGREKGDESPLSWTAEDGYSFSQPSHFSYSSGFP